jgi:mRNA interferase MazF
MMRRGEVRWYRFGRPDKRRPVVLLTRDSALEFLNETTIAPVMRTIRDIPSEVILTVEDGMPQECAVNLDHIQTVSKSKLGGVITTLNGETMNSIQRALSFALGF